MNSPDEIQEKSKILFEKKRLMSNNLKNYKQFCLYIYLSDIKFVRENEIIELKILRKI
jgi:hypothetical protein